MLYLCPIIPRIAANVRTLTVSQMEQQKIAQIQTEAEMSNAAPIWSDVAFYKKAISAYMKVRVKGDLQKLEQDLAGSGITHRDLRCFIYDGRPMRNKRDIIVRRLIEITSVRMSDRAVNEKLFDRMEAATA